MNINALYTDFYELTMSQVYFHKKRNEKAVFDYYFRNHPFEGGYTVFAGLQDVLEIIQNFAFPKETISYLKKCGFDTEFLEYLENFSFTGKIYAMKEGEIVFPDTPILVVEAPIIEAQIIETVLLNILNYQSLIATKARRIRQEAKGKVLIDMGFRRAHATGALFGSRAAMIGGFDATSNVLAAQKFALDVSGTMAHSFVQSYEQEIDAFRDYAQIHPNNSTFLVDTYNTLESGIPNAIQVAHEMEKEGNKLQAVRLDSGDLAYLSKRARQMLDEAGLDYVKIVASNQLDEWVIKSLKEQEAPIDIYGVGTNLITGKPDASLDGVYKLTEFNAKPKMKFSDNIIKISTPCKKQVYRVFDADGKFYGADAIALFEEEKVQKMLHPFDIRKKSDLKGRKQEKLLDLVMEKGKIVMEKKSIFAIADYSEKRLALLDLEYKRFQNPHIYKVGLSEKLKAIRDTLFLEHS